MVARNEVGIDPRSALDYVGAQFSFLPCYQSPRRPTVTDRYVQFALWRVGTNSPAQTLLNGVQGEFWYLSYYNNTGQAIWLPLSSGSSGALVSFTGGAGTSGFPVFPNGLGQVQLTSTLGSIAITGTTNSINFDLTGGGVGIDSVAVQTGTSPVIPTSAGLLTINGAVVPAGTNPVRTDGTGANTLAVEVQISQSLAAADVTKIGLSNFDSTSFSVAATGFVSLVGGGFTWNDVSGAFSPLKSNGYFITGTATGTLPASPSQGDTIKFFVDHPTQVLTIDAPGTQLIRLGSLVTSAGGTAVSTLQGDSVELTYRASNTCWCAIGGFSGTWVMS